VVEMEVEWMLSIMERVWVAGWTRFVSLLLSFSLLCVVFRGCLLCLGLFCFCSFFFFSFCFELDCGFGWNLGGFFDRVVLARNQHQQVTTSCSSPGASFVFLHVGSLDHPNKTQVLYLRISGSWWWLCTSCVFRWRQQVFI